jgi:hypothetical protein
VQAPAIMVIITMVATVSQAVRTILGCAASTACVSRASDLLLLNFVSRTCRRAGMHHDIHAVYTIVSGLTATVAQY